MKFFSPLTAEFFPNEPDWENESYNEYEGYPMDGHDLLQYADAVDEAVKKDIADFNGDLMQYYHEDDSRLLWNTCCAVTASDSFEFWVGIFTGKDKWASYANSIFLLYHLFIL